MDVVFIVVAVWIALDIAIIAGLSHLSRKRHDDPVSGPRSLTPQTVVPSPSVAPRTAHSPARLRLVGDVPSPALEPRLRAASHR